MLRFSLALAVAAVAMPGCDGDGVRFQSSTPIPAQSTLDTGSGAGQDGSVGMCDRIQLDGTCVTYNGPGWNEADAIAACNNGTWNPGGRCARTQDSLGHCVEASGLALEVWFYYYRGDYWGDADVGGLEGGCEQVGGAWFD